MGVRISRDATANDALVYAWPFPLGPEDIEVACGEDEIVVMCPSWLVGDRLGPGRHLWRTPDPTRPVSAYFVSTQPVECSFDVATSFMIPTTQQGVTLRAQGSVIVRCGDPGLLIAQFVGLPFDTVNDGLLRSVTRSIERLIARVLTRRVVMAGTPMAVSDPAMLPSIIEELVAYNPAAGAVFGVEFVRLSGMYITADDGSWTTSNASDLAHQDWTAGPASGTPPPATHAERGSPASSVPAPGATHVRGNDQSATSGEISVRPPTTDNRETTKIASGEIVPPSSSVPGYVPPDPTTQGRAPAPGATVDREVSMAGETIRGHRVSGPIGSDPAIPASPRQTARGILPPPPAAATNEPPSTGVPVVAASAPATAPTAPISSPPSAIKPPAAAVAALGRPRTSTLPNPAVPPPIPGSLASITPRPKQAVDTSDGKVALDGDVKKAATPSDGVPMPVMGIGMGGIGIGATRVGDSSPNPITSEADAAVSGEIVEKLDKGSRVLVPGADGRLVAATIKQEQSGYYELEIGGSSETLWVPRANVVADKA